MENEQEELKKNLHDIRNRLNALSIAVELLQQELKEFKAEEEHRISELETKIVALKFKMDSTVPC